MSEAKSPESGERAVIPVANPASSFLVRKVEVMNAIERVYNSGWYILGPEVEAFEREFAAFVGAPHAVGVASGTDAVALALRAVGVEPGDEVVTVSHSAVATVAAIEQIGAVPVFADICPVRRCLDPQALRQAIGPKTKAIVVVHIFGQPADMARILEIAAEHDLRVVEDCAQAHGARIGDKHVGTFADAGAFSFYPTKNLGAMGDGGAVTVRRTEHDEHLRALRQYGWDAKRRSMHRGVNSRLDELQAAVLRVMLTSLEQDIERRRRAAARYDEVLDGLGVARPALIEGTHHAYHLYVIEHEQRDALARALRDKGVATGRHYPHAIHEMPAYSQRVRGAKSLPQTQRLYGRSLSLPMFAELSASQVDHVCEALSASVGEVE